MPNIVSTLCELTKGEYWSNKQSFKEEFINRFYNGSHVLESVNMETCNQFFDKGSNAELLIYSSDGLEYRYSVDYDKLESEFKKKRRSK